MSYWQILGISHTTDLAAIKRAYATKLKLTKPDENPEGFKCLHAAYKQATEYAKNNANTKFAAEPPDTTEDEIPPLQTTITDFHFTFDTEESSEPTTHDPQQEDTPPYPHDATEQHCELVPQESNWGYILLQQNEPPIEEVISDHLLRDRISRQNQQKDAFQRELEEIAHTHKNKAFETLLAEREDIFKSVDEVTEHITTMNYLPAWKFLNDRDVLLDLQFKFEISHYIFGKLAYRLHEAGENGMLRGNVFDYLDSLFLWSDRRDLLEDSFGYESVDFVLHVVQAPYKDGIRWSCPEFHQGNIVMAGYLLRISAIIFDWVLLGCSTLLLTEINHIFQKTSVDINISDFITGIMFYTLLAPIMEATPLQGTPGKILFGIKVVSYKGRRLHIAHSLLRSVMFFLSTIGIKLTLWINLLFDDNRLLHDRISRSMVIER
jgi:uncharacterized RDD family membrane protein YckC